jgi:coproporphyrinogen III oxidase-like Fe-S oxidoreductase
LIFYCFTKKRYFLGADTEITLETNPDDITPTCKTEIVWKQAGINRLSVGIQSFIEEGGLDEQSTAAAESLQMH